MGRGRDVRGISLNGLRTVSVLFSAPYWLCGVSGLQGSTMYISRVSYSIHVISKEKGVGG